MPESVFIYTGIVPFQCNQPADSSRSDNTDMYLIDFIEVEDTSIVEEDYLPVVQDFPRFQGGGTEKFKEYIAKNLHYPETAAKAGVQGTVLVQFIVSRRGDVEDAKIVRSVDPDLDKEALRVIKSSPKWMPGPARGRPVKVHFTMPITFKLPDSVGDTN